MARKKKRKNRKSLSKRIASVGGLNRHGKKQLAKHFNRIPDEVLEKRARRMKRTVGGRKLIGFVLEQNT